MQKKTAQNWQKALSEAFTDVEQLCEYLDIKLSDLTNPPIDYQSFPLKVPRGFADSIEKGNPDDPILRQVLPVSDEHLNFPGYLNDPVGDLNASPTAGVLHKYHGRALLITTGSCAINCRYCFRRNFPYSELQLSNSRLQEALNYIQQAQELTEIILSGGDPLLLSDERLKELITQLNNIRHIQRIRIHSRIPVVLPERITPELLKLLTGSRQKILLVIHANHANELSQSVSHACRALITQGIILLNQSVLLKSVNDTPEKLITLSEKLFEIGVLPYYLHLLDKATGTGHFEVSKQEALNIHKQLQTRLPGYLVPKLVAERAGAANKILLYENNLN